MSQRSLAVSLLSAAALVAFSSQSSAPKRLGPGKPLSTLSPWVDPLPIPPSIKIAGHHPPDLDMTLSQITTQFHSDFPSTEAWGYNGTSPGPTIEVDSGTPLRVHWRNELPAKHLLAMPIGTMDSAGMPEVRSVTHLHGAEVEEPDPTSKTQDSDGWPDNWTVAGQEQVAEYPNRQSARALWYHDHALGEAGRNVAAGLVGMYLIRDHYETSLNLPRGQYEIPLLFQSQGFNGDGTRYYTPDITLEHYGNSLAVNGKIWPYLNVEPRKYRFRMVNASNARTIGLTLSEFTDARVPGPAFYQIGSDAGFLQDTVVFDHAVPTQSPLLTLGPAERADVIIDFSKFAKKSLLLENFAPSDAGEAEIRLPQLLVFNVSAAVTHPDTSSLPVRMRRIKRLDADHARLKRQIVINQMLRPDGNTGMVMLNGKMWHDPISERPVAGSTETWSIVNTLNDTHPIHIHLVQFQVVGRTPYNVDAYVAAAAADPNVDAFKFATGPEEVPAPNELGWKDLVRSPPNYITRLTIRFPNITGFYVYHCHILEHEDMDMMRPFQVVK